MTPVAVGHAITPCSSASPAIYCDGGALGGSVTSVAATVPSYMSVTGLPITGAGTLAFTFGSESSNTFFGGGCGSGGAPAWRLLCVADIPTLTFAKLLRSQMATSTPMFREAQPRPADTTLSALLDAALGNAQGGILYRGASAWSLLSPGTSGQVLQTQGSSANPTWASHKAPLSGVGASAQAQALTDYYLWLAAARGRPRKRTARRPIPMPAHSEICIATPRSHLHRGKRCSARCGLTALRHRSLARSPTRPRPVMTLRTLPR